MAVFLSSGAFRTRSLPEVVSQAQVLGIRHLELSSGVEHFPQLDAYVPVLKSSGIQLLVHNYFPAPAEPFVLNLGALDAQTLEASREHVRNCIDLSSKLGASYYSVHSAFVLRMNAEHLGKPQAQADLSSRSGLPDRNLVRKVFIESLKLLCAEAAHHGLDLLVENNVVSPKYLRTRQEDPFLMTNADEIEDVLQEVGAPNIGLLMDVAHARVSSAALGFDLATFVRRLRPYIRALHLSDNDGQEDQNLPMSENSWFWRELKGLGHLDAVVEVYRIDDDTILSQMSLTRRKLAGLA